MLPVVSFVLLVFAFVLFVVSGWFAPDPWKARTVTLGLACWVLAEILNHVPHSV